MSLRVEIPLPILLEPPSHASVEKSTHHDAIAPSFTKADARRKGVFQQAGALRHPEMHAGGSVA
jgi:hypothetical protein